MPRLPNLLIELIGLLTTLLRAGDLALENLALRQQLASLRHARRRPKLSATDRAFWVLLRRLWSRWTDVLAVVKPETVVGWHKQGFKLYWTWKSRRRRQPGRPPIDADVIANHMPDLVAADFIVVPTASFRVLYAWVLLSADRREVLHFGVTENPTALWLTNQLREAFAWKDVPKVLLRDRDAIYGEVIRLALERMGIGDLMTQPRSPWQNGMCERLMGSIRRGRRRRGRKPERQRGNVRLLDHVVVLVEIPEVGGLHHRYVRERRPEAA